MPIYNSKNIIESVRTESIHLENAIKLLDNWNKILPTLSIERQDKINNPKNGLDPLKIIRKIVKDRITSIRTTYKYSVNLKKSGRLYPEKGILQGMPREFRALLQVNQYDVDIINCHPVLLSQLCKKHKIECSVLNEYVKNRKEHIKRIADDMRCDFGDIKHAFLSVLNGAIRDGFTDRFFRDFKNEITEIHLKLKDFYPDKYKSIKSKKDFNELGSLMNVLLCEIENEILICCVNYFDEKETPINTFVFDGFMIDNSVNLDEDELLKLSDYVFENSGYRVVYVIKNFDSTIDLSKYDNNNNDEYSESSVDMKNLKSYTDTKRDFELNHAKIQLPPSIITEIDGNIHLQSFKAAGETYLDLNYLTKDKKGNFIVKSFFHDWLRDSSIRKYEKIVFSPPPINTPAKYYNTWVDFEIKKIELVKTERDYWAEFRAFSKKLFKNSAEEEYIIARYAYKLQNPAYRTFMCIIYYGLQGNGKNRFLEPIYKIFGKRYTQVLDKGKKLYEKFSLYELEKELVRVDEAGGIENFENSECLKSRITAETLSIEPKGINAYDIDLYADYDMTTNFKNVVKCDDGDRGRFYIVETTSHFKGNTDFWKDYSTNIVDNPQALRQIYEGFMNFDVSAVVPSGNFQNDKPHTQIEAEVKALNRDNLYYFLEHICRSLDGATKKYGYQELFTMWSEWCIKSNIKNNKTIKQFQSSLREIVKGINNKFPNTIVKDTHSVRTINGLNLKSYFHELNSSIAFIDD
jgi:hypothetical protein